MAELKAAPSLASSNPLLTNRLSQLKVMFEGFSSVPDSNNMASSLATRAPLMDAFNPILPAMR